MGECFVSLAHMVDVGSGGGNGRGGPQCEGRHVIGWFTLHGTKGDVVGELRLRLQLELPSDVSPGDEADDDGLENIHPPVEVGKDGLEATAARPTANATPSEQQQQQQRPGVWLSDVCLPFLL